MPPERLIRVVVNGVTGRMGRMLAAMIAAASDLELTAGLARKSALGDTARALGCERIETPDSATPVLEGADVVIDFSSPEALGLLLGAQRERLDRVALVVGTTGLDAKTAALLDERAGRSAVVVAANFSVGMNLLLGLVEQAAAILPANAYDIEIVEAHHKRKADAPSGTALALGEAAAKARGVELGEVRRDGRSGRTGERPAGEIGFHAIRGGGVAGAHHVLFLGQRERVELTHEAADRSLFAEGALTAARWAVRQPPGRYTMRHVLGI